MDDQTSLESGSIDSKQDLAAHLWEPIKNSGLVKVVLAIGILINLFSLFKCLTERHDQQDFAHYYASSKLYLDGDQDLYKANLNETYEKLGWKEFQEPIVRATNPPTLIKLFAPFALLPPRVAHGLWTLLALVSLCGSIVITYQIVRDRLSNEAALLVIAVFIFLPFLRHHFTYAQVQLLLMAMILIAFRLLQNQKGLAACLLVSVAALIKIYPIAMLPWFVWRSGSTLSQRLITGVASACTLAIGIWLSDISLWQQFAEFAQPSIAIWVKNSQCFTLCSAGERIGSLVTSDQSNEIFFKMGLGLGILFFVAFYGWIALTRKKVTHHSLQIELALLILLTLFGGATCWWHYLVFLLFPMAVAAACLKENLTTAKLALACITCVSFMQLPFTAISGSWVSFLGLYLPLWGMLLMAGYLAYCMVTDHKSPSA